MLLYIHIPFCDSKCSYCAFNSYVDKFHLKQNYMNSLLTQLKFELKRFDAKNGSIESLFIGGGTPSTVEPSLYKPIFELLSPYLKDDAEITSEANPNSSSKKWLKGMRELGVNRISFGVQSFDDKKLKLLNRAHSSKQAKQALLDAKDVGFENLSLDIIYGVYGDTKELLQKDIDEAFLLPINHISG
ncbi:MAG: radical SAM family heme chaperone HemW, partial [Campylobacterales bacterium]|nr:radical SAM family heme chaperone HemW [Campylobacterales bacterium]